MIRIIGLDLDGTLYPSTEEIQKRIRTTIYQKIATSCGISLPEAKDAFETSYAQSSSGSRAIEEIANTYKKRIDGVNLIQDALQEADILDLIQPNEKVSKMLNNLGLEFNLDLITGSRRNLAREKLERLQIPRGSFKHIWTKEDGHKSSGELYKTWLSEYNADPQTMLYVGDNKKQDIDSPKRLGIKTCYIGQYAEADFQIKNILELEELVKQLK